MGKPLVIKTTYTDEAFQVANRGDSVEVNFYRGDYVAYRAYVGKSIRVYSSTAEKEHLITPLVEKVSGIDTDVEAAAEEFYRGEFSAGREMSVDYAEEIVEMLSNEFRARGLQAEVILVSHHEVVEHVVKDYEARAREERWLHELYVYPYALQMGHLASSSKLLASSDPKHLVGKLENLVETLVEKISLQLNARAFNPLNVGKWTTLLSGDAACAFYHELAHLLQADEPIKLPIDAETKEGVVMVEDPFYPGPLQRVFDDEQYPAWRRVLLDNGVVVDYLRTRLTSNGSKPGNARGLFTKPKPMHHQLVVKPGDWRVREVFEEFERLIVVENIAKAEMHGNYVDVIPEHALICEKEKCTPVRGFALKIPIVKLSDVLIGLTRDINSRYSYEKSTPLYEVAPSTIVNSRVVV